MLRLFTTLYPERQPLRRAEYAECLLRNLACAEIDEICLLVEGEGVDIPDSPKIRVRTICQRPHYSDFFDWINQAASPGDISIIANTDIWFDDQLSLFRFWRMSEQTVFTLSRWDFNRDGTSRLHDHNDSQDTWILVGKTKRDFGDFPLGVARCDNRIAADFESAGYRVLNPAFSLKSFHIHDEPKRLYLSEEATRRIPPPYKYVWPHNLFSFPEFLIRNWWHPEMGLSYRIDRRLLSRTLPWKVFRKLHKWLYLPFLDRASQS